MDIVRLDLRFALRNMFRAPGFSLAAIATLALGIGSTTAIFSVVHALILRPLPFPEPDRLVVLYETDRLRGTSRESASMPDFRDFLAGTSSFESLSGYRTANLTLMSPAEPERINAALVTEGWFRMLRRTPGSGRSFTPEDHQPGKGKVALVGHGLWQRRFGGDASILGRAVRLDGEPYTVVGVIPSDADIGSSGVDLWIPRPEAETDRFRGVHNVLVFGRLRDGVSLAAAQSEMDGVMTRLEQAWPDDNKGRGARVEALHEAIVGEAGRPALLLLAAVAAVLLIGCANVANLLLARAAVREKESAICVALGAGRGRMIRQSLADSALLSLAGAFLGVLLAAWGIDLLRSLGPAHVPGLHDARLDAPVLGVTFVISVLTAILAGTAPALRLSRPDLARLIAPGVHVGAAGTSRRRARQGLVAAQAGLTMILLAASGLLLVSFWNLARVDRGFDPEGLVTVSLELPEGPYPRPKGWPWLDWPRAVQFADSLIEDVKALPGVRSAAIAMNGPTQAGWTTRVTIEGRPAPPPGEQDEARFRPVGPGYFHTIGARVVRGREFDAHDRAGAPLVAMINESFARRYFPGEDPIGRRIFFFEHAWEIVGVASDVKFLGPGAEVPPAMYTCTTQNPSSQVTLLVRTETDPIALIPSIRRAISSVDPDLASFGERAIQEAIGASLAPQRFTAALLAGFAVSALILAAVGTYGVLSFLVAARTREVGVRVALGAGRADVLRLVLSQGMAPVVLGMAAGLVAAPAAARWMGSLLFGVTPIEPGVFVAAPLVLLSAAAAACLLPATRAARLNPVEALRVE